MNWLADLIVNDPELLHIGLLLAAVSVINGIALVYVAATLARESRRNR